MDQKARPAGGTGSRLDPKGNSVRGVAAFTEIADELGLHAFECSNIGSAFVRSFIGGPE